VFHLQDKTLQQVQAHAERIYYDIARKLFVASGIIDGMPSLNLQDSISLVEMEVGELQGFAEVPLTIASVAHRFQMPRGKGKTEAGFTTEWKAHYLPAAPEPATEDPVLITAGGGEED